jgi:environmental stress-induced protein Ves
MIIRSSSLKKTSWKNGGGVTTEIARSGGDHFSWRLSFAEITIDSSFSVYAGYDRALVVWKGNGIRLGGELHLLFEPFYFSGDVYSDSQLIEGPVVDLVLIYRRSEWKAEMTVVHSVPLFNRGATSFLFVIEGVLNVDREQLWPQDTLLYENDAGVIGSCNFCAIYIQLIKKVRDT